MDKPYSSCYRSKDNTWTDIRVDKILDHNSYRYLKLYNSAAWSGDVAEVEFYGDYDFNVDSKVLAPDGYTRASYYLYQQEVDRIKAAMSQPGADKIQLAVDLKQAEGLLVSTSTTCCGQNRCYAIDGQCFDESMAWHRHDAAERVARV